MKTEGWKKHEFFNEAFWKIAVVVAFVSVIGVYDGHGYLAWFFMVFGVLIGGFSIPLLLWAIFHDVNGFCSYNGYTSYDNEQVEWETREKKLNFVRFFVGIVIISPLFLKIGQFLLANNITLWRLLGVY